MKNIILFILFFIITNAQISAQVVNYIVSNNIIANPERGLQKYSITGSNYHTKINASTLSVSKLTGFRTGDDKVTVIYRLFLLDAFLESNINTVYLNNIQKDFDKVRSAGLKVIVRFAYTNVRGNKAQQPTKSQILTHISQLKKVLTTNQDVIFSHQAGFVGTWGEWYYTNSTEFGSENSISASQWSNRREVVEAMLSATPSTIPIQVRSVNIKKKLYGNTQLNSVTAYKNNGNARIGFYNDAFLNRHGDQGTYSLANKCDNPVGSADFNFISNETKYLPMTGETNAINSCDNGFRTTGKNAVNEMNLTNWTALNRDYYIPFWNDIIATGYYDEILKNLGYRFVLNSSTVNTTDTSLELTLNLKNVGYARVFKKRNVYLVMQNTETNEITKSLIDADIRTWEREVVIKQNFNVEKKGTYKLFIWIPDDSKSLQSNSSYSIQFANKGLWDASTGYNDLLQTVTIGNALYVEDLSVKNNFLMHPNPTSNWLTVSLRNIEFKKVQIHNTLGQLVLESSNAKVDVSMLTKGIYFVTINNNRLLTKKFIKE